ncbi:MAG TPA: hydrogenase maturation protease [bacterium]|jgi:hydrogenase maturation protease
MKILVLGYGNPGREDDGLGPALLDRLEKIKLDNVTCQSDYQLNIEYAEYCSLHDVVIFVDASVNPEKPFIFRQVLPSQEVSHTTHSMSAESVVALCESIYGKRPRAFMLEIKGFSFEIGEGLSGPAEKNLDEAFIFLHNYLLSILSK